MPRELTLFPCARVTHDSNRHASKNVDSVSPLVLMCLERPTSPFCAEVKTGFQITLVTEVADLDTIVPENCTLFSLVTLATTIKFQSWWWMHFKKNTAFVAFVTNGYGGLVVPPIHFFPCRRSVW